MYEEYLLPWSMSFRPFFRWSMGCSGLIIFLFPGLLYLNWDLIKKDPINPNTLGICGIITTAIALFFLFLVSERVDCSESGFKKTWLVFKSKFFSWEDIKKVRVVQSRGTTPQGFPFDYVDIYVVNKRMENLKIRTEIFSKEDILIFASLLKRKAYWADFEIDPKVVGSEFNPFK